MQEPMGINKLANMFMGNPQPLAAKVEQAQKQAKPGQLPPDLKEALALQEIQEAQQHAQNQQAMQAGGPQQTVMDKLRQLTGTVAQATPGTPPGMPPAQPQMPMVQAAHGGSIAHLVSNLGHHYGGGGIVAFDEGGEVDDEPAYASVWRATKLAKEAAARKRLEEERARNMAQVNAQPGEMRPVMRNDPRLMGATPAAESVGAPAAPAGLAQVLPPKAAPAAQAPRPPAAQTGQPGTTAQTGQPGPAADDLKALLKSDIANTLKRNPEDERDKGAEYYKKTVGLDALLADQEARAKAREARYKESQENRTPDWVRGLQALGGAPVRGGLGMVLAQAGRGATSARDEYAAADAKFADEQDRLRDIITKAKIEGNTGVANAGMKALEQLRMEHQSARTSGTSLLNTEEMTAQRREQARQHNQTMAANRATAADQRNMSNAINAIKADPIIDKLLKDAEALSKMPTAANQAKAAIVGQQIEARQNAIYKQFGVLQGGGTMAPAPGAASPGGTSKPGWGIKPIS